VVHFAEKGSFVGGNAVDDLRKFRSTIVDRLDIPGVGSEVGHAVVTEPFGETAGQHCLLTIAQPDTGLLMDQLAKGFELAHVHRKE
jgi:hypothetical protein